MNVHISREEDYYILSPVGELDASSCTVLDNAIAEAVKLKEKKLLVNFEGVSYISSAGMGVFMSYLQDFEDNNISMVLYNMSAKVKDVFKVLGLDELINISSDKEAAKNSIDESKL
ncbi:STAS domain-containing protein [Cytophagaceae bacterium ABcell3]|nr:STAS domain-containing protein [Cytophagaceae bacterium ABcell3]